MSAIPETRFSPIESARISRGTFLYVLCLATVATGFYLYWWFWKLKIYFISWAVCLLIVSCFRFTGHLRMRGVAQDMLPIIVWYAYLSASAVWSPSPSTTLYQISAIAVNPLVFLVSYAWAKSTSQWALSAFFEFETLLILPIVLWYLVTIGKLYDASLGALRSEFAATCLLSLPFLIWRVRSGGSVRSTAVLLAALGFLLAGDSRSALLIMPVLVLGAVFLVARPRHGRGRLIATAVLLSSLLFAMGASIPGFRDAVSHSWGRFSPTETRLSISPSILDEVAGPADVQVDIERRLQLFISLESFLNHPMLGAGYQSTYVIIRNQFGREVSAHGLPSTLLGETGLVGTALFVWMIARFFKRINSATFRSMNERSFYSTCKLTMLGMLLLGLFHQVDQSQALFVLLAWGYALPMNAVVTATTISRDS